MLRRRVAEAEDISGRWRWHCRRRRRRASVAAAAAVAAFRVKVTQIGET